MEQSKKHADEESKGIWIGVALLIAIPVLLVLLGIWIGSSWK